MSLGGLYEALLSQAGQDLLLLCSYLLLVADDAGAGRARQGEIWGKKLYAIRCFDFSKI